MFCPNCGYDVGESKFCSKCGNEMNTSPEKYESTILPSSGSTGENTAELNASMKGHNTNKRNGIVLLALAGLIFVFSIIYFSINVSQYSSCVEKIPDYQSHYEENMYMSSSESFFSSVYDDLAGVSKALLDEAKKTVWTFRIVISACIVSEVPLIVLGIGYIKKTKENFYGTKNM